MPRKMIYIDNHIRSSKTLKDEEFFQSLSRSPEHPLPTKDQMIVKLLAQNWVQKIGKKKKIEIG
jgi:hypothetical protein